MSRHHKHGARRDRMVHIRGRCQVSQNSERDRWLCLCVYKEAVTYWPARAYDPRTWLYNQWPVGATLKELSTHSFIFNLSQATSSLQRKTCCRPGVHVTGTFQLVSPDSHTTNRDKTDNTPVVQPLLDAIGMRSEMVERLSV